MFGIAHALFGFCALAWSGAFLVLPAGRPQIEVPARVVEQREEAVPVRSDLARLRQPRDERHLLVVEREQRLGFAQWLLDLQRDGLWTAAVDRHEVGNLAVLAADGAAGQLGRVGV